MKDITPEGSIAPVYRAEVDESQRAADDAERERIAVEQVAAVEARKAPLRRLGLTDTEIDALIGA